MKDTFQLIDSFGVLSLLFSNKEKYKDHPVLKRIEELPNKPLYIFHDCETLYRSIRYKESAPIDSIKSIVSNIIQTEDNAFQVETYTSECLMPNCLYEIEDPTILPVYITKMPNFEPGTIAQESDLDSVVSLAGFFLSEES